MSLDYDLRKVVGRDMSEEGRAVTTSVIFATIVTRLGEITEDNWQEFWARAQLFHAMGGGEFGVTPEQVREHIGLHTNVYPSLTRKQWRKQLRHGIDVEVDRLVARAASESEMSRQGVGE